MLGPDLEGLLYCSACYLPNNAFKDSIFLNYITGSLNWILTLSKETALMVLLTLMLRGLMQKMFHYLVKADGIYSSTDVDAAGTDAENVPLPCQNRRH